MAGDGLFRPIDPRRIMLPNGLWEPVVAVAHATGVAAVCRDREDGSYWLTGSAEHGGGTLIEPGDHPVEGLGGAWAQGGLLPAGATRALVSQPSGEWVGAQVAAEAGVWVAVVRDEPGAVRFEAGDGRIVRQPLSGEPTARRPSPELTDPCLACGAVDWETAEMPPLYPEEDDEPYEVLVCRRCGHSVEMGGMIWVGLPAGGDAEYDEKEEAEFWRRHVAEERSNFERAAFPVYGVAAWHGTRRWAGSGGEGSLDDDGDSLVRVTEISLAYTTPDGSRQVEVTSDVDEWLEPEEQRLREIVEGFGRNPFGDWDEGDPESALVLKFERARAEGRRRAAEVQPRRVSLRVGASPVPFLAADFEGGSAAVATIGDVTVDVVAIGLRVDDLELEQVTDIEPFLKPPD